jgi:hypothetical protein
MPLTGRSFGLVLKTEVFETVLNGISRAIFASRASRCASHGPPRPADYEDAIDRRQCPRNAMDAAGAKHESCERRFNRGNRGSTLHRRVAVGYFLPRPAVIVIIGLVLWLGQMLASWACTHLLYYAKEKYPTLYSLTTVFTFAAAYGLAVVFVGYISRAR